MAGTPAISAGKHALRSKVSHGSRSVGQFDLGPAAAFSLIYFLIILLCCFVLYNLVRTDDPA